MTRRRASLLAACAAIVWLLTELALAAVLSWGGRTGRVLYWPVRFDGLSEPQTRALDRLVGKNDGYLGFDAELGWTNRPGGQSEDGPYRINAQGARAAADHAPSPAPGVLRLLTFGDSFTFGCFVREAESWQRQLEASEPNVEAVNFGVNGYGPDQAWLRYRALKHRLQGEVVVIGYMSENIARLVNRFRPFYIPVDPLVLPKPRFELERDGSLRHRASPLRGQDDLSRFASRPQDFLPALAQGDYWAEVRPHASGWDFLPSVRAAKILSYFYRHRTHADRPFGEGKTYRTDSSAYRILLRVLEGFSAEVMADGRTPLLLIYPREEDVVAALAGRVASYASLTRDLSGKGLRFVDLLPAVVEYYRAHPGRTLYTDGHFDAEGNRLVAEKLRPVLAELRSRPPSRSAATAPRPLEAPASPR